MFWNKKTKNSIIFKSYSNSKYQSVLTNNNLKHKPICDSLKKTKIHFENFKLFRRMPKYAQPSIKRIFRKKRKNIYFRKNFIFTKRWRAPVLRSFKKKSEIIQKKTINSFGE